MKRIALLCIPIALTVFFCSCANNGESVSSESSSSDSISQTSDNTASSSDNQLPDLGEPEYVYKSESVGWATFRWNDSLTPDIYETNDGGQTWERVQVEVLPEMLEGAVSIYTWPVRQENGQWTFSLLAKKDYGYPSNCFYDFILDESNNTWIWSDPQWDLPNGVDEIYFIDYVAGQTIFNPTNYNFTKGLTEADLGSIISLMYDTSFYQARAGKEWDIGVHVSFDNINQFALAQYGNANFDIRSFLPQLEGHGKFDDTGFYVLSDGPAAVTEGLEAFVHDVNLLDDGTIEVYTITVYWGGGGDSGKSDPQYRRSIYTPAEFEGVPIFTLLFSEQLDFSLYSGTIPESHWAQ